MNRGPLLFLGIFLTMATSFWGLILVPGMRIGRQQQVTNEITGMLYPVPRSGLAQSGADVYRSLGCVECHSQQVRGVGYDLGRRWGPRMTVAQDYLGDYPVFLGIQRIGSDLSNIGLRQTSRPDMLRHLYIPQAMIPGSMMPPYTFLFEKRKLRPGHKPDPTAILVGDGFEVVPGPKAEALAAYLLSLRTDVPLFEAPIPRGATGLGQPGQTNAASTNIASTNAPAGAPGPGNTNPSPATAPASSNPPGGVR